MPKEKEIISGIDESLREGITPRLDAIGLKETPGSLRARLKDLVEEKEKIVDPEVSKTIFPLLDKMRVTAVEPKRAEIDFYPEGAINMTDVIGKLNRSTGYGINPHYKEGPAPPETLDELRDKVKLVSAMRKYS